MRPRRAPSVSLALFLLALLLFGAAAQLPVAHSLSAATSIPVGTAPKGIAYDSGTGEVFVPNEGSNTVSVVPAVVSTTTSVYCYPSSVGVGSSASCTATVAGSTPTSQVTFSSSGSGSFSSTTCQLSSGSCGVTFTPSVTGSQTITATYGGDSNNGPSSGTATVAGISIVASTANADPSSASNDRKVVFGSGLWWVFWADGGGVEYATSSDGATWSAKTTVPSTTGFASTSGSNGVSVWLSGTTVSLVMAENGLSSFTFEQGALSSGGTITWGSQSVVGTAYPTCSSGSCVGSVSVVADSSGNIWVAVSTLDTSGGFSFPTFETFEYTSSWAAVSPVGGPFQTSPVASPTLLVSLVSLSSGQVGILYTANGGSSNPAVIDVSIYSSGSWSTIVPTQNSYYSFSAVGYGSTVYVAGIESGASFTEPLYFWTYALGQSSPIGTEVSLDSCSATSSECGTASIALASGTLVVAYGLGGVSPPNLYYQYSTNLGSSWSAVQTMDTYDTTTLQSISAQYDSSTNSVGVIWGDYVSANFNLRFAEVTVPAPAQVTVSLTLNADSSSTAVSATNYFTVSYTSGGSAQTAQYTGTPLSFQADANTNVEVSATTSASSSTEQWCLSFSASACQTTTFSTGSSGATATYYYYDLLTEPVSYSLLGGGSYVPPSPPQSPHLSYATAPSAAGSGDSPLVEGSPGVSGLVLPNTPAIDFYILKGTTATVNEYLGGAGTGEQWALSSNTATFSTVNMVPVGRWVVTSANQIDDPMNFQHQYQVTFASNPSSSGSTAPSGTSVWEDAGSPGISIAATANPGYTFSSWSSSTGSITFSSGSSSSTTASIGGTGTITANFASSAPSQTQVSITLTPDSSGSSALSASNYFTVSYTSGGAPATADYTGSPLLLTVDVSTTVTISAATSGSNQGEMWCLTGPAAFGNVCGDGATISVGASPASASYYYYDLIGEPAAYAVVDGGSPSAPSVTYVTAPSVFTYGTSPPASDSPLSVTSVLPVYNPMGAPPIVYALRGTTVSVPDVIAGGAGEQWMVVSSTATVSGGAATWTAGGANPVDVPINYYHQYQITFASNPGAGGTTTPSGTSVWEDAASLPITATASTGYAFNAWSSSSGSITFASSSSASTTATIGASGTITADFGLPSIALNPTSGPVGTTTQVTGSGFPASTQFNICASTSSSACVGPFPSGTANSDGSGAVASCTTTPPGGTMTPCTITFPAGTAVGTYYVVLLSTLGPVLAYAQFTVTSGAVTFTETGLPASTSWGVTFNSVPLTSTGTSLTTGALSVGSYSWSVPAVACGTGCRYVPSPGSGSTTVPAGSAVSIVFTKEYSLSMSYSISVDGAPASLPAGFTAPTLSYTSDGSPATAALTTAAAPFWVDSGTTWSVTNPLAGSGSTERFYTGAPSGSSSASTAVVVSYFEQWYTTLSLLPAGSSAPIASPNCFTVSYTSLGVSGQTQQQCSQTLSEWMDAGSGAGGLSIPGKSSGSTSSEEWCIDATCAAVGITVQGSQLTPTLYYYDLLLQTVQYSITGAPPSSPVVLDYATIPASGSVNGNSASAVVDLTSSPQSIWALRGTSATAPVSIAGATGIRWLVHTSATISNGQVVWTIGAANAVDNPVYYYEQFALTLSYSVSDGGSPTAPAFTAGNLTGTSTVTLPLSPTTKLAWFNSGASYTVTDPLTGSTSTERWYALSSSGTVASPATISVVYYHQYLLDFVTSGSGTITLNGDRWENASVQVDIAATPAAPSDFLTWVSNTSSIVFGDQYASTTWLYVSGPALVTGEFGLPSLAASPSFGPAGTSVTLTGVNYTSEATYNYCFEPGVTSSPAVCSSTAQFRVSFVTGTGYIPPGTAITIPQGASTGLIVVSGAASGAVVASALFTVTTPSITTSPSSGAAGTSFAVGGTGLAPDTEYNTCIAFGASGPPTQACQAYIYAIGGQSGSSPALSTVEVFDPATNAWSTVASLPEAVTNATAFSVGGMIYVVGGVDSAGSPVSVTQVYDPATNSWSTGPAYPLADSGLASASNGTLGFAFGGTGASGVLGSNYLFSPSAYCWSTEPMCGSVAFLPTARTALASAYLGGEAYSIGGRASGTVLGTVEAYNTTDNCWSTQASCLPTAPLLTPAYWLTASAAGGLVYAMGGTLSDGSFTSVAESYNPASNTWSAAPSLLFSAGGLASAEANGLIYTAGGKTAGGYITSAEVYNPATNVWSQIASMPAPRAGLAMVTVYAYPNGPGFSGSYQTNGSGALPAGISGLIPGDNAPGAYYFVVSRGSQVVGYSKFTVASPSISISSSAGSPGATITLTGTGFSPSQYYEYCLASSNQQACPTNDVFVSTSAGDIPASTTLSVPSGASGGLHYVTVSMQVFPPPNFPTVGVFLASDPFTVQPTISLSASSGQAGTTFTLTAGGLLPSTQYGYCFSPTLTQTCAQQGIAVATLTSDGSGAISASITVPASASPAGPFYFLLETTGSTPAIAASAPFVVTATVSTVTQTTGGSTSVNDASVTGTSVDITGSTASDGTSANITTTVLGSQPAGTSGSILTSVGYYDVHVTGLTDGTAQVCIENPGATKFSSMQYYDTGTSSWVDATPMTFTAPDTLCGTIPVADLTGTPILLGAQPVTVSFSATGYSPDSTGVALTVDGVAYSASELPVSFSWLPGSVHTYSWSATVSTTEAGKQYAWSSTSGAGVTAMSGTVSAPPGGGTVAGSFAVQYYLGMTVSGSGSVSPPAGWFGAGSSFSVTATPSSGATFTSWTGTGTGSYTGTANPASITMSGPVNETAAFATQPTLVSNYAVTLTESGLPAGTAWQATFEGVTLTSTTQSMIFSGTPSGTGTWNVPAVQGSTAGVRYEPGATSGSFLVPTQTSLAVNFATQYLVSVDASPAGAGTVSPSQGGTWYAANSSLSLAATPGSGFAFVDWSATAGIAVASPTSASTAATVSTFGTITANFASTAPACSFAAVEDCQVALSAGGASVNETSTGISVVITGSAAQSGTMVNITTVGGSSTPPAGVGQLTLTGVTFYDVRVTGISTGSAKVCIASKGLPSGAAMEYWDGSEWLVASNVSVTSTGICGMAPVSALAGTPFAVGSPATTVTTTTIQATTATSQSAAASQSTQAAPVTTASSTTSASSSGGPGPSLAGSLAPIAAVLMVVILAVLAVARLRRRRA